MKKKSKQDELYEYADKVIAKTKRYIQSEFQKLASILPFDELNYIETKEKVTEMYDRIDKRANKDYKHIILESYKRAIKEVDGEYKKPNLTMILSLIIGFNLVTKYIYKKEYARKRERLVEGLMSSKGAQQIRQQLKVSMNLLSRQVREYSEQSVRIGRINAFKDNKITKVMWVAEQDNKTCEDCLELDGKTFDIDLIPDAPHYYCRCYVEPFITDDKDESDE